MRAITITMFICAGMSLMCGAALIAESQPGYAAVPSIMSPLFLRFGQYFDKFS